jgi:hypothetical protein
MVPEPPKLLPLMPHLVVLVVAVVTIPQPQVMVVTARLVKVTGVQIDTAVALPVVVVLVVVGQVALAAQVHLLQVPTVVTL